MKEILCIIDKNGKGIDKQYFDKSGWHILIEFKDYVIDHLCKIQTGIGIIGKPFKIYNKKDIDIFYTEILKTVENSTKIGG